MSIEVKGLTHIYSEVLPGPIPGFGRYQFPGGGWPAGRTHRAYRIWDLDMGTASQRIAEAEEGTYHSWRCGYYGRKCGHEGHPTNRAGVPVSGVSVV